MSTYLLQDLVRVREHREEEASQAVARALRKLQDANQALARARHTLADYTAWRLVEEKRQLDAIMRRPLKVGEIADVRQSIALLREREFELIDQVAQAEAAVTKAAAHLAECRVRQCQAVRDLEKLVEHRRLWQLERAREQEMAEDLELEDFTPRGDRFFAATEGSCHERN